MFTGLEPVDVMQYQKVETIDLFQDVSFVY